MTTWSDRGFHNYYRRFGELFQYRLIERWDPPNFEEVGFSHNKTKSGNLQGMDRNRMMFEGTRSGSLQVGVFIKFVNPRVSLVGFMTYSQLANHNLRREHNRQIWPWSLEEVTNLPSSQYFKVA